MRIKGILLVSMFLFIGCGGSSSSPEKESPLSEDGEGGQVLELNNPKFLNETVEGRWDVFLYDKNNKISQKLYYYDFRKDGELIYGSPYQEKEYVLKWVMDKGFVKIFFKDFNLILKPIDYYSESNRIINMREVSSSGSSNIYAWDKLGS